MGLGVGQQHVRACACICDCASEVLVTSWLVLALSLNPALLRDRLCDEELLARLERTLALAASGDLEAALPRA